MVEVVVPERVEAVAPLGEWTHQPRLLRLVLGDDDNRPPPRRLPRANADRRHDVLAGEIVNRLCRVQPQAVEMELVDPVGRVGDEELTHRSGVGAVEVDRIAPLVGVAIGEVGLRKLAQVIAVGAEVVVDDVEDDADAGGMRGVDKAAEVVRRSVEV